MSAAQPSSVTSTTLHIIARIAVKSSSERRAIFITTHAALLVINWLSASHHQLEFLFLSRHGHQPHIISPANGRLHG